MLKQLKLSPQCLEQLDTWVRAHRSADLRHMEFLAGLWVIVEDEMERAVLRERGLLHERLQAPSSQ
ncbi:MAG: hypothetical protein L0Z62_23070 [Gemmataceae bacterium]|nr:hypothetical protein [Gemmataceae bacterium]